MLCTLHVKPSSPRLNELSKDTYRLLTSYLHKQASPKSCKNLVYLEIKYRKPLQDMTKFKKMFFEVCLLLVNVLNQKIQNFDFFSVCSPKSTQHKIIVYVLRTNPALRTRIPPFHSPPTLILIRINIWLTKLRYPLVI